MQILDEGEIPIQFYRPMKGDISSQRHLRDRRRHQRASPSLAGIRLTDHAHHLETAIQEVSETFRRDLGRPEKNQR